MTTSASAARPDRSGGAPPGPARSRFDVRAGIAVLAIVIAAVIVASDDQDPIVFAIPVLVLAAVLIAVITIAGRDEDGVWMRDAARETGLTYDGVQPLPPVTPILRDVRAPAPMMSGDLDPRYGPTVRVARTRDRLVALVETVAPELDAAARGRIAGHPLRPEAAIEDGLLVVAVDRDAPPRELLELTRALRAGL
jgi:hypothetical protein